MSLCINPSCQKPHNPDNILFCEACGSELLLEGRYRVIRKLGEGGFGKTFEVSQNNTLKVLKVLTLDDPKAVSLFQQEARVLTQLNHSGIPKAEVYFTFFPRNSQSPLHCLVMEKIEGLDLSQYMEQRDNRPIDEKLAILWLTQLANILNEVHKQNFFHRDIKPSNIMLKADGHLALIDFGTAREVTKTYYQKAAGQNITGIISPGYTPLEQANGKAVPQSDFFALGRTFIYLLTGKSPDEFSEDSQTGKLIWRDSASQVSKPLAGLIDYLSEPFSGKRPQNAEMILRCISDINNLSYLSSTSASTVPSTLVKPPQQHTQHKTVSSSQQQSSKNQTNESSQQIYQGIGALIGGVILIFFRFGWKDISKIFRPQASQPVAISQPTEIQKKNNPKKINSQPPNQAPHVSNKNTYPQIPYGWKKFQGGGASLWLPPNWQPSNLQQLDTENFMNKYLHQNLGITPNILAVNSSSDQFVLVFREAISPNTTLRQSLKETYQAFLNIDPNTLRLVDMRVNSDGQYETGIIVIEANNRTKQISYLLNFNNTSWAVSFICKSSDFEENLQIFESSIRTFILN
jgi:serine/threonine protein kinase